ncbi:MAG: acyl-ACP--UDP-N-acetylglucosamine O-acyltransferase [Pirellulales bacterium]|nr:acyl-ACP--UDP-N-acetylglucosamine O-acyltransferase [Pirellulales bacterium]
MNIHPIACISPSAKLGRNVQIGPFCVVEAGVVLGDGCRLASHVVVRQGTVVGRENRIFEGVILGGLPQHIQFPQNPGGLVIGDRNVIREHVTMHRSLDPNRSTQIGSDGLYMAGCHVAHDCQVGNGVILTNHVLLAGHVAVGDRAVFGGAAAVHQFCRVGRLAMIGGMARVHQDVPPFMTLDGGSTMVVGLNQIGLRRAGMNRQQMAELKAAYQIIYRQGLTHDAMIAALKAAFPTGPAAEFAPFFEIGKRGFVQERRTPPKATVRLFPGEEQADAA